jgi:UDP-glucose:(heptosyl)LPS alpha-1,3-glucosyltransferase
MQACLKEGDQVDVYVIEWQGEMPANMQVHVIPVSGFSNHARLQSFHQQVLPALSAGNYDLVFGFNKMPGLDLYYAADPCYIDRAKAHPLYPVLKFTGRVAFYKNCEAAVFGPGTDTVSLMISDVQQALFKRHYGTPDQRLVALPPGIDPDRQRPDNAWQLRQQKRQEYGLADDEWLMLMVGTGFKTKGVDRSIAALASIAENLRSKVKLFVIGDGDTSRLIKQAKNAGIEEQVEFLGGRPDVPEFLLAADLLIHPARKENTGTVILEAIVAGLPVLVSDVCGYAKHVLRAQAGELIENADDPQRTAQQITAMLKTEKLKSWSQNALQYGVSEDLYSMPEHVAQLVREMALRKRGDERD